MRSTFTLKQPTPQQQLALSIEFRELRAVRPNGFTQFEAFVQGRLGAPLTEGSRNTDEINLLTRGPQ
jgi:hypothetical protein